MLVNHPKRTAVDVRLLSQVELNIIRSDAYRKIVHQHVDASLSHNEARLRRTIDDTSVELSLWLQEWTAIVSTGPIPHKRSLALQNLHIQREWALMTLSLKAIAVSGIENIVLMTDFQQDLVRRAKDAAARHLYHVLEASASSPLLSTEISSPPNGPTYLSTFKWTLDYVWAKCTFSVLIVLKLAILLRDPVASVMSLLQDAHRLLGKLKNVTVGHIAYFQILQTSIEKCEAALREHIMQQTGSADIGASPMDVNRVTEDEFQG
jgi:hypothetical protein